MSKGSVAPFIEKYYPEYYQLNEYPVEDCIPFVKVKEQWGILGNFAPTPLEIDGVRFENSEQLFQMMKFIDPDTLKSIYHSRGLWIKKYAKTGEKLGLRRPDWGQIIVDVMKFCLQTKYDQSEEFRHVLNQTAGKIIVEDQSSRKTVKTVDTWGAVRVNDKYFGSNLLGRLLMELRDNGKLEYHLPDDMFDFIKHINVSCSRFDHTLFSDRCD